jgi:CheY-like chemotaxis protein
MRILLIEDLEEQGLDLEVGLKRMRADIVIERLDTEEAFEQWHRATSASIAGSLPDIAIIDIMLPYRWPREEDYLPGAPPIPTKGPIAEAGIRCAKLLRGHAKTKGVPAIFYTALPPDLLSKGLRKFPDIQHKRKDGNFEALLKLINNLIRPAAD